MASTEFASTTSSKYRWTVSPWRGRRLESVAPPFRDALSRSDVEGGHLFQIADEKKYVRDDRMVPGFAVDGGEFGDFLVAFGHRLHERHFPALGEHDEPVAGKHNLTVSVPSAFPFQLAGGGIDAGKNGFVQSVNETVTQYRTGELVLHPRVLPDRPCREPISGTGELEYRSAFAVARRDEHSIVPQKNRLRDADAVEIRPGILPQQSPLVDT